MYIKNLLIKKEQRRISQGIWVIVVEIGYRVELRTECGKKFESKNSFFKHPRKGQMATDGERVTKKSENKDFYCTAKHLYHQNCLIFNFYRKKKNTTEFRVDLGLYDDDDDESEEDRR